MFKEPKESMIKEIKGGMMRISHQIMNASRERNDKEQNKSSLEELNIFELA